MSVNVLLPGERRMVGGRDLDGGIWLDFDGKGRVNLRPDQALSLAHGIMRALGYTIETNAPPIPTSRFFR